MTWLRFLPPSCLFAASLHHFLSSKRLVHCADGQQQQQQQQRQQKSRPALRDQRLDDRVFLVAVRKFFCINEWPPLSFFVDDADA